MTPQFEISPLFGDGAVLCRDREIRLFGTAPEGAAVTAELRDRFGRVLGKDTAPAREGRFLLRLPPQTAQEECTLTYACGGASVVCKDVVIGDVYLAGGQSNMELELQNADEGPGLIETHDLPLIRYFNVPKCARPGPETEQANRAARWQAVAPGKARDMSAVAYFFAMRLHRHLNVPVGIIDCYWGGTSVTCWLDEEALGRTAEGRRYMQEYDDRWAGKSMEDYLKEEGAFFSGLDEWAKKADQLKKAHPEYTSKEINAVIGPCPPWNPPVGEGSPFRPHGLFHTMMERLVPAALTGVLFYQGEEDTWRTQRYDLLLSSFILRLRELFECDTLPFLNVQLPMWIDGAAEQDSMTWPPLRLAQQRVADQTARTGLAVLIDQGEFDNIHPTNKRVVGDRLFDCARRVVYGEDAPRAPRVTEKYTENGVMHILLDQSVRDRGQGEFLLEIAGEDGIFCHADTVIDGRELFLSSPRVPRPVQARYAWRDYGVVRLFGENGLPLAPFWLK
ncbi:MAG: hypothetical protein J5472_08145 [Clostridia bacterium]|nr:hypothetical protein [Clostridia bacterium]